MTLGYLVTVLAMIRVGRSCCSATAPVADDDRAALDRGGDAYLLHLSR
jgi:hypothetical protein